MGTRFHLPPELERVADRLGQLPLPNSRVDRDQLFYEAGRTAGQRLAGSCSRLVWKVTSGVLAATVLVMSALLIQQSTEFSIVAESQRLQPVEETVLDEPVVAHPELAYQRPARQWPESANLLALRDAALRNELEETRIVSVVNDSRESSVLSARELLEEFLPKNVASGAAGG